MPASQLTLIRSCLQDCGYTDDLLQANYRLGTGERELSIPLAGFVHRPFDTRSACLAVVETDEAPDHHFVSQYRPLGAPVVFVSYRNKFQWWKQNGQPAEQPLVQVEHNRIRRFFEVHSKELAPERIYRAKTLGGLQRTEQLHFVDVGLMPLVEQEIGDRLSALVTRVLREMAAALGNVTTESGKIQKMFGSAFWLLAARILRDKDVRSFRTVDLADVPEVFARVARHYGEPENMPPLGGRWRSALQAAAKEIDAFSHLGNVSTEALGYLYENTLITKSLREQLATHSTPPYLVDYIVWQLAGWIGEIPPSQIRVFEPACGHAAFLVSTLRLLKDILSDKSDAERSRFLRRRIRGVDIDDFALEIAKLSLTLADIPNPNGWQLECADMFTSNLLVRHASRSSILLMNPPYTRFTQHERARYARLGKPPLYSNKASEALRRTLHALPAQAVFGLVLPQGFLHSRVSTELRRSLVEEFELAEICLFPDKVFEFSDMETTVIVGRRVTRKRKPAQTMRYRRVREADVNRFRTSYQPTSEELVPQSRFQREPQFDMRVADFEEIWLACRSNPRFSALAYVGQGLFHKGKSKLPRGRVTVADQPFEGSVAGFARFSPDLMIHELPSIKHLNVDSDVVDRKVTGATTGLPQVLLNYARVSRGPWRLKALLDRQGHAVTSRFLTLRPKDADKPVEYLWALCNSPVANAYVYSYSMKRDILVGLVRNMPVPAAISPAGIERVVSTAREYLRACSGSRGSRSTEVDADVRRDLLVRMDAEVLRLYDLPPRLERRMVDLFTGYQRAGVPFRFDHYYPDDFRPYVPLHVYLSREYRRSTAGELRLRWEPVKSEAVLAALRTAVEAYGEE